MDTAYDTWAEADEAFEWCDMTDDPAARRGGRGGAVSGLPGR